MKTLVVVTLAALTAFITIGNAQPFGDRGRGAGGRDGLRETLNLDDATAAKIEKLRDDHRKNQIALRAKLDAARVDFRSQMRREQPDEKLAMAKQKEMSAIREEIQAAALAHRFDVSKLLTPEQRKMLKGHRGEGFGMENHRGPGSGMMEMGCGGCCDDDGRMDRGAGPRHHRMGGRGRR